LSPILAVIARLSFRVAKTMPEIPHEYGLDPTVVSSAAKSLTGGIFEQIEAWEGSNF
jgi:hypothetical protein